MLCHISLYLRSFKGVGVERSTTHVVTHISCKFCFKCDLYFPFRKVAEVFGCQEREISKISVLNTFFLWIRNMDSVTAAEWLQCLTSKLRYFLSSFVLSCFSLLWYQQLFYKYRDNFDLPLPGRRRRRRFMTWRLFPSSQPSALNDLHRPSGGGNRILQLLSPVFLIKPSLLSLKTLTNINTKVLLLFVPNKKIT